MNKKGFILYEGIIIFLAISSIIIACLNITSTTMIDNSKLEKKISKAFTKENKSLGKECNFKCLIKKGLSP